MSKRRRYDQRYWWSHKDRPPRPHLHTIQIVEPAERIPDGAPQTLKPGQYQHIWAEHHPTDGRPAWLWMLWPPRGILGYLTVHTVTVANNGDATVFPSILQASRWHGFLTRGVWEEWSLNDKPHEYKPEHEGWLRSSDSVVYYRSIVTESSVYVNAAQTTVRPDGPIFGVAQCDSQGEISAITLFRNGENSTQFSATNTKRGDTVWPTFGSSKMESMSSWLWP